MLLEQKSFSLEQTLFEQKLLEQKLFEQKLFEQKLFEQKLFEQKLFDQKLFEQKTFQHLENFRFRICRPWKPRAGQPEHRDADSLHLEVIDHDGRRETVGGRKAGSGKSFSVSYNWIFIVNKVDTFKSNAQLIYWNTEINNYFTQ